MKAIHCLLGVILSVFVVACGGAEAPVAPPPDAPAKPESHTISWTSGADHGELKELEPAISSEESRRLRDSFRWSATKPVSETAANGHPALYYALVYVQSKAQVQSLDDNLIHYSFLPLFEQERVKWKGKVGTFMHEIDGRGLFTFAIMPGRFYNAFREAGLAGKAPYTAIILRDAPAEATDTDGSLSYRYLAQEGFRYRGMDPIKPASADGIGQSKQPLFGWIVRHIVKPFVEAAETAIDGVRMGLGELDQLISGEARLNLNFTLLTTDPAFGPQPYNVAGGIMRQGWGANRGRQLPLSGVEVRAIQSLALHTGDTNDDSHASIVVAEDRDTQICVLIQNDAAEVTTFLTEVEVCDFGTASDEYNIGEDAVNGTKTYEILVRQRFVNALAQFTDVRRYMKDVVGHDVSDAKVLVGDLANVWPNAATPCMDYFNVTASSEVTLIGGALLGLASSVGGAFAGTAGELAEFLYGVDMVLPDDAARSRGVPTHEYGHYTMCSMMYDVSYGTFTDGWTEVMTESLDKNREPSDHASVVAEGWADFISGQVVGGVNYFAVGPYRDLSMPFSGLFGMGMFYCNPNAPGWVTGVDSKKTNEAACLEDNIGGPELFTRPFHQITAKEDIHEDTFNRAVGRYATLIHDAFDGQSDFGPVKHNLPGNGAAWPNIPRPPGPNLEDWNFDGTVTDARASSDEQIALPGAALFSFIQEWTNQPIPKKWDEVTFDKAMARVMTANGATPDQICELFRRHDRNALCPTYLPISLNATPARVAVTGQMLTDRRGQWTWTDSSAVATAYQYTVTDLTHGGMILYSGMLPYSPTATFTSLLPLPYNSEIKFEVRTLNGTLQGPVADHRLFTPAERVWLPLTGTALPEQVRVGWTATQASRYLVERRAVGATAWSPAGEIADGTGFTETLTVFGLNGGTAYDFRVVALNLIGEPAAPSPTVRVTPIQPEPLYVSASTGNDADPLAGPSAHPYKTIQAAFARIDKEVTAGNTKFNATLVKVAQGTYNSDKVLSVGGNRYVRLAGGYVPSTWATGGGTTSLTATAFSKRTAACSSGIFAAATNWHLSTYAAVVATAQSTFAATDITIEAQVTTQPDPGSEAYTDCYAALQLESSNLWLRNATARTVGDPVQGACRLGVQSTSPSFAAQVQLENATVEGLKTSATALPAPLQMAGMCLDGVQLFTADGSTLAAIDGQSLTTSGATLTAMGAYTERTGSVQIARTRAASILDNYDWNLYTGFQTALLLSSESALVHNSVLRTAHGGTRNSALILNGQNRGRAHLYENTIAVGEDFELTVPVQSGMVGSAMVLIGKYDSFQLVNNLLVYAGGANADTSVNGVDRRGGGPDPRNFVMRGNVFSIPEKGIRTLLICNDDEFGQVTEERFLNMGWPASCNGATTRTENDVGNNYEFFQPPAVYTTRPLAILLTDGHAFPYALMHQIILSGGGTPLTSNPLLGTVQADFGGALRDAAKPSIGAWKVN